MSGHIVEGKSLIRHLIEVYDLFREYLVKDDFFWEMKERLFRLNPEVEKFL